MESAHVVAHENVHFSNGNYETRSSKLAMKMRNAEVHLKVATVLKARSCARLPELASKLEKLLQLVLLRAQEQAFN